METVTVVKGEWYRFGIANITPNVEGVDAINFYKKESRSIEKSSCEVLITGYDGVYFFSVPQTDYHENIDYFPSTGSSSLELAVKCTEDAFIRAEDTEEGLFDWAIDDIDDNPVIVNVMVVEGKKSEASPCAGDENKEKWVTNRPDYLQNFCDEEQDEYWDVTPSTEVATAKDMVFLVNGLPFDANIPVYNMKCNTVQEWAHCGTAGSPGGHPMHNNVWHQQICGTGVSRTDRYGLTMEYGEFVDNVRISNNDIEPCYTCFKTMNY